MIFDITPSSPTPIYRQIVDQVRRMVLGGQLRAGEELPSIRRVAQEHIINPMTVSKAYAMLEAEGLLERKRGVGMVIAESQSSGHLRTRLEMLQPYLDAAARVARQLEIAPEKALAAFERRLTAAGKGDPDASS